VQWSVLVADRISTGHFSKQYWSPPLTSTGHDADQYWLLFPFSSASLPDALLKGGFVWGVAEKE